MLSCFFAAEYSVPRKKGAGEFVADSRDTKTGVSIFSIYGTYKKPPAKILNNLDIVVFDIQDVGTRFYTYVSFMYYMMGTAAENDVAFLVLNRPNPKQAKY